MLQQHEGQQRQEGLLTSLDELSTSIEDSPLNVELAFMQRHPRDPGNTNCRTAPLGGDFGLFVMI